jgi:DNA-binding FrmR family transcriptional regulator
MIYLGTMKTHSQRINNIIGQLNGIKEMIETKNNHSNVLMQLKAAKSALGSLIRTYSEDELVKCLGLCDKDKDTCSRFIRELVTD